MIKPVKAQAAKIPATICKRLRGMLHIPKSLEGWEEKGKSDCQCGGHDRPAFCLGHGKRPLTL